MRENLDTIIGLANVQEQDPRDFTDKYNTKLTPLEEARFQEEMKGRLGDLYDYDLRGAWKEAKEKAMNESPANGLVGFNAWTDTVADFGDGHGIDKFKKPNHITFSDESKYHGVDGYKGGHWDKDKRGSYTYTPPKDSMWSDEERKEYWMKGDEYANANHLNDANGKRILTGEGTIQTPDDSIKGIINDFIGTYSLKPNEDKLMDAVSFAAGIGPALKGLISAQTAAKVVPNASKQFMTQAATGLTREALEGSAVSHLPDSIRPVGETLDTGSDLYKLMKLLGR